jgi:hypothetical protein
MSNDSPGKPLTQEAFDEAAEVVGIEAAKLWAVMEIEAKRCGFLDDQRPIILFERHKFSERTKDRFSAQHPDISHKKAGGYGKGGAHRTCASRRPLHSIVRRPSGARPGVLGR